MPGNRPRALHAADASAAGASTAHAAAAGAPLADLLAAGASVVGNPPVDRSPAVARLLLLAVIASAVAACGAADRAAEGVVVRDSAGVRIVENSAPAWGPDDAWRIPDAPVVRIGAVEGAAHEQFFRIAGVLRLDDGRIVVADDGARELRFYDAAGRFLFAVGRDGAGPGEFRSIRRMGLRADSIWAYDAGLQRVSLFTTDGRYVRSFALPAPNDAPIPAPIGWFGDGSLLAVAIRPFWHGEPATGVQPILARYLRLSATGEVLGAIGEFFDGEHFVEAEEDGGISSIALPFARNAVVAVDDAGFYFGTSDAFEILRYAPDGRLERRIRRAHRNAPVTEEDLTAFIRERQRYVSGENARRSMEAMFRRLPLPSEMPAYADLRLDAEGNLWVEEYRTPGAEQARWAVFDADGRWLGVVALPPRFTPLRIGADFVLGREVDELDVQYVTLYRIEKPGAH